MDQTRLNKNYTKLDMYYENQTQTKARPNKLKLAKPLKNVSFCLVFQTLCINRRRRDVAHSSSSSFSVGDDVRRWQKLLRTEYSVR